MSVLIMNKEKPVRCSACFMRMECEHYLTWIRNPYNRIAPKPNNDCPIQELPEDVIMYSLSAIKKIEKTVMYGERDVEQTSANLGKGGRQ